MRFLFVGIIAVFIGEMFAMPLTHLCIDPKNLWLIDIRDFCFWIRKICRKLPYIGKNILSGHWLSIIESIRSSYQKSHLMFADIPTAATWQKAG